MSSQPNSTGKERSAQQAFITSHVQMQGRQLTCERALIAPQQEVTRNQRCSPYGFIIVAFCYFHIHIVRMSSLGVWGIVLFPAVLLSLRPGLFWGFPFFFLICVHLWLLAYLPVSLAELPSWFNSWETPGLPEAVLSRMSKQDHSLLCH